MRTIALLLLAIMCSCNAKDVAEEAMNAATRLAAEGKYEQALEKQVWFHNHALETRPSYYGVRLSYALSEWIELGKTYPAALAKLKGIRDEKTSRLLAGEKDRELFHDVVSISDHLGELEATVGLFKKLEAAQPGFAASVYDLADDALVTAREYGLAKKYLGDPIARLESAKRNLDEGMEYARKSRSGDASRKAFERIFTDEIVRIITVLDKTGSPEAAREVQSKALAILETPAIRDAIENESKAMDYVGKTVLIGVTYLDHEEWQTGQHQWYGVITEVSNAKGIVIALKNDTKYCALPPDLSVLRPAKPGKYRLRSTGEVVTDPDYLTTWTCKAPDPNDGPRQ